MTSVPPIPHDHPRRHRRPIASFATASLAVLALATASHADSNSTAVQWRTEDGGNGHWYRWIEEEPTEELWTASASPASAPGFKLVVIGSEAEDSFLTARLDELPTGVRCWIGCHRIGGTTWGWREGETSSYWGWGGGNCGAGPYPNYGWSGFLAAMLNRRDDCGWNWDDFAPAITPGGLLLLEYAADCNHDGIVDYGQILDGTVADLDQNGVPDCCDAGDACPGDCPTDLSGDGVTESTDLGIMLALWGTDGQGLPEADIDRSSRIDASDLALILIHWGPCPQ